MIGDIFLFEFFVEFEVLFVLFDELVVELFEVVVVWFCELKCIVGFDVVCGFVFFGIFFVNIDFMLLFVGVMEFIFEGKGDGFVWFFVEMFCEGKFYLFFLMFFGVGFIL